MVPILVATKDLTLAQAAAELGKTQRQIRYMIKTGKLPARKVGHGWQIQRDDLPRDPAQLEVSAGKREHLRAAMEEALDHWIKRSLKFPGYLRYMDDVTLFDDDRGRLHAARAVAEWLAGERRLTLKDPAAHVHRTADPCVFLGFHLGAAVRPGRKIERRLPGKVRAAAARGPTALARTVRSYRALWDFG